LERTKIDKLILMYLHVYEILFILYAGVNNNNNMT